MKAKQFLLLTDLDAVFNGLYWSLYMKLQVQTIKQRINIYCKKSGEKCLDFFELATFGTNYGLQAVNETVTRCSKVVLQYFVPSAAKRFLEAIDTLVFFRAALAFQGPMIKRISIRKKI